MIRRRLSRPTCPITPCLSGRPVPRRWSRVAPLDTGCFAAMLHCMRTHLLTVQSRGTVALPAELRRRLHLDQDNAQIQLIEGDDGRIELRPVVAIPADQAWFWTDRWQAMEREADADVAGGRTTVVDGLAGLENVLLTDRAGR
jgi:bifunctional DNA-binding transcriptional regulator/antitoxin component of YhaV-PrlF toxin-antitoxin module